LATQVRAWLEGHLQPIALPDGHLGWDAAAASAVAAMLRPYKVTLPNLGQAAGLRRIFALGKDAREQSGWRSPVENFWCQDAEGRVAPAGGKADHLPVILVPEHI
jgi:hypothetical protein